VNNSRGQSRNKLQKQPTKTEKPENQHPLKTKDTANAKNQFQDQKQNIHSKVLCAHRSVYMPRLFFFLKKRNSASVDCCARKRVQYIF
jgi:hypothetical protein